MLPLYENTKELRSALAEAFDRQEVSGHSGIDQISHQDPLFITLSKMEQVMNHVDFILTHAGSYMRTILEHDPRLSRVGHAEGKTVLRTMEATHNALETLFKFFYQWADKHAQTSEGSW